MRVDLGLQRLDLGCGSQTAMIFDLTQLKLVGKQQ